MLGLLAALLCMIGLNLTGAGIVEAYSSATYLLIWYYAIVFGFGLAVASLFLLTILLGGTAVGTLVRHPIIGFLLGSAVSGPGFLALAAGAARAAAFIGGAWFLHAAAVPDATRLTELDTTNLGIGAALIVIGLLLKRRTKKISDD